MNYCLYHSFYCDQVMFYILMALYGFTFGANISNLAAIIHDFCGPAQFPVLFGLYLMAEGLGSLVVTPLCGKCCCKLSGYRNHFFK